MNIITIESEKFAEIVAKAVADGVEMHEARKASQQANDDRMPIRVDVIAAEYNKGVKTLQKKANLMGLVVQKKPMTIYRKDILKLIAA